MAENGEVSNSVVVDADVDDDVVVVVVVVVVDP